MSDLKAYKFDELYEMSSGISTKPDQAGHGTPFLSFSTVFNNYFLPDQLNDLMSTSEKEQETYSVLSGDVFLTRTSEVLDELGISSVALKDYPKSTYSGFLKRLRPIRDNMTYPKYMGFYLRSYLFRKSMNNNATMTLRASLNETIFSYLQLILPEYKEQVKIGDLLFLINTKIELNNKINAELEAMAKTLYDYWFLQFDFPNQNGKPYKRSGGKMVYNAELKREIPEGWGVGNIGDYAKVASGFAFKATEWQSAGNPVIKIKNILEDCTIDLTDCSFVDEKCLLKAKNFIAKPFNIVIAMTGATIGKYAIIPDIGSDILVNQRVGLFDLGSDPITKLPYLINSLKQSYIRETIITIAGGCAQPNISAEQINNVKLITPSDKIISEYNKICKSTFVKIINNQKENRSLAQLRNWLLPMLMNGQVKVV